MKKLMAVLLVLSLLVSSAAVFAQAETTADAEAIELNWADFEELRAEIGRASCRERV